MEKSADELAHEILARTDLCTIATASSNGKPEAAAIYFVHDSAYNIYFETLRTSRKYKNLQSNNQASIVVTEKPYTIQMDGVVTALEGVQATNARMRLCDKLVRKRQKL